MCGGANHGLYKRDPNAPQPERTKRVKTERYRLYTVVSRFDAYEIERAFYNYNRTPMESLPNLKWWNHPCTMVHSSKATDAQILNWPEIKPFLESIKRLRVQGVPLVMGDIIPMLVWVPMQLDDKWLETHPIKYTPAVEKYARVTN